MIACNDSKTDTPAESTDSTATVNPADDAKATDSSAMEAAQNKMEAGKDSITEAGKMMDKAADKMEAGKDSVMEAGKMMDKAADKMKEAPKKN